MTTQHERDVETGFDYRGARFYDAEVGRFLSLDPLAVDYPSWSDYSYVMGNPVIFIDPDGKNTTDPPAEKKVGWGTRILGIAADLSPAGPVKGAIEAFTGKDLVTGEKLSGLERGIGVVPGGKILKTGGALLSAIIKYGDEALDVATSTSKNMEVITNSAKATENASEGNSVYRALRKGENPSKGLNARAPGKETPIGSHVMGKKESNLISTTKDPDKATGLFNSGNGVVKIDLNKVNGEVMDVSSGFGKGRVFSRTKSHIAPRLPTNNQ